MSVIWIVPIVAVLIGAWLAWDTFSKRGPTITIEFTNAGGLTPGQSQLKFKDVPLGTVKSRLHRARQALQLRLRPYIEARRRGWQP